MISFEEEILEFIPLEIKGMSWDSIALNFYGDDWGFYTLCCWRIFKEKELIGSAYENSDEALELIKNNKIVYVTKHLKYAQYVFGKMIISSIII